MGIYYFSSLPLQFAKECSESEDSAVDDLQCYVCNQPLIPPAHSANRSAEAIMRISCGHKSVSKLYRLLRVLERIREGFQLFIYLFLIDSMSSVFADGVSWGRNMCVHSVGNESI